MTKRIETEVPECEHMWITKIDSQWHSETEEDVECNLCGMVGSRDRKTGEVFYPAT